MANKRITEVDYASTINSDDCLFVNQGGILKQVKKKNVLNDIIPVELGGTGATSIEDALTNLKAIGFKGTLTSADDLDKIIYDGIYVYATDDMPANAPYSNAAVILVFGSSSTTYQKIQIAIRYGEAGHMSFRGMLRTWQDWTEVSISGHTHAATDITSGTLQIEQGGTGATSRKKAYEKIAFIGANPLDSSTEDTPAKWSGFGNGYAWISAKGQLVDQPAQWGLMLNICYTGEVFQIWNTQSGGGAYFRSGNSTSGWSGWKEVVTLDKGKLILNSNQYGTTLPAAGTKGRIFFKKAT